MREVPTAANATGDEELSKSDDGDGRSDGKVKK